jgi:hypothetical protein
MATQLKPPASFSVREGVHAFLRIHGKAWEHDRSATIGASEIGQCARRVWFLKNGIEADDPPPLKGAAIRGDLIEQHIWVPAMRTHVESLGGKLLFAGEEQQTLADGYLSCTPDGIAVDLPGEPCLLTECKSIDPRVTLSEVKSEHFAQVQVQLGIVRACTEWKPERAIVSYINASFFDGVEEFEVTFDPAVYLAAKARALSIMDATAAMELRPEGKMAGGKECAHCPWASRCAHEQAASVPAKADVPLGDNALKALEQAVARQLAAKEAGEAAKAERAEAEEEIKEILRAHGARRFETSEWGVSWSSVKGRTTTDLKAAAKAGVDLTPFTREGDPSERLTIKSKKES